MVANKSESGDFERKKKRSQASQKCEVDIEMA